MPELSVLIEGEPVNENLVLLKGYLLNNGRKDITPQMTAEKISVRLPDGFKWVKPKVISVSEGLEASIHMTEEKILEFNLGLFRRKEFIKFEVLAEVLKTDEDTSSSQNLLNSISFKHRIADTSKVTQDHETFELNLFPSML